MLGLGLGLPQYLMRQRGTDPLPALIAQLYGNGEQGAMYVPQPVVLGQQVLFQDAEGTVPVTTDGDPVGLMLDVSQGVALGPELVTNGTFDTDIAGWTEGNSADIFWDDGRLAITGGGIGNPKATSLSISLTPGRFYEMKVETFAGTFAGDMVVRVDAEGATHSAAAGESSSRYFKATKTSSTVTCWLSGRSVVGTAYFDNISVRELPGAHAVQSVSAERPVNSDTPPLQIYDGVDDAMNVALPSIAAATVATATPTGTVIQYPVDLSAGSYTISESHSGIIIREGELTATEQQRVTDYLDQLAGV